MSETTENLNEYFVVANSFAAPLQSDESTHYVRGKTPEDALQRFANSYRHPAGLYAANLYADANAYHKHEKTLAKWRSNAARNAINPSHGELVDGEST